MLNENSSQPTSASSANSESWADAWVTLSQNASTIIRSAADATGGFLTTLNTEDPEYYKFPRPSSDSLANNEINDSKLPKSNLGSTGIKGSAAVSVDDGLEANSEFDVRTMSEFAAKKQTGKQSSDDFFATFGV